MTEHQPRGEGFAGQHMVVLPEPLRVAARVHPLLRGLHVTDAGYFPTAVDHLVERAAGAPTTLVILCMHGEGWVQHGGGRQILKPGGFVWLPAREPHAYGADAEDPWSIAWAHFVGEEVAGWKALLEEAGAPSFPILSVPADRLGEVGLHQVHSSMERGEAVRHQVSAAAALRGALSAVAELAISRPEQRSARDRVAASVETLRRDWTRPHRLEALASAAGMSITHYSVLFRQHTGFAPIDFLIRLRVKNACRLLDTTDLSVSEVAAEVGYQDPYYFTRCFRRVMGHSPRKYRMVQKG